MQTWYYSTNGERQGPVSFDELKAIARRGALDPVKDLAWTEGMKEWSPSGQVPGLHRDAPAVAGPFNPYAAPGTASEDLLAPVAAGAMIPPGSADLDIMGAVSRAIELTKRNFLRLLAAVLVFGVISWVIQFALGLLDDQLGWSSAEVLSLPDGSRFTLPRQHSPMVSLVAMIPGFFLTLGLNRIALNVVSGDDFSIGMLFSQGAKLIRMTGASLLFYLMVGVGFVLLIVPGVYLAMRFGFYSNAIVDRNMGVIESLKYSSDLTKNNRLNMFGVGCMMFVITLAGILALCVGLLFAVPVVTLLYPLAYRFLQYGPQALRDQTGTREPVLRGQCSQM
jgi:GYF domain 2